MVFMSSYVVPHKLPDDLRGRTVLPATQLKEVFPQLPLDPDTQSRIFHALSVAAGYTMCQQTLNQFSTEYERL